MPSGLRPLLLAVLALGLAAFPSPPIQAQQPAPSDSAAASPLADSLQAALERFEAANPPTAADSATLRRRTHSVQERAGAIHGRRPQKARKLAEAALAGYRAVADSAGMASAINEMGTADYITGNLEQAAGQYRRSLKLSRQVGASPKIADNLTNLGLVHGAKGRYEEAIDHHREALRISRAIEDSSKTMRVLNNVGLVYRAQGRYEHALDRFREALTLSRELGDSTGIAFNLTNIGTIHGQRGEYRKALENYREALPLLRQTGNRRGAANTLSNMGQAYQSLGQYEDALSAHREALQMNRQLGARSGLAGGFKEIGLIYKEQGRYDRALSHYRDALEIYRDLEMQGQIAALLNRRGNVALQMERHEEALQHYREALEINRELDARAAVASNLNNVGLVYKNQGRLQDALETYREALAINRETGDRSSAAANLNNIGAVYRKQNRPDDARQVLSEALRLNQETGRRASMVENLQQFGKIELAQNRPRAAVDTLAKTVRLTEAIRRNATSMDARRSLLATQIGAYRFLTTAHLRLDQPDSALRSVEQARARLLTHRLADESGNDSSLVVPSTERLRRTLAPEETALLYARPQSGLTALVVARDSTTAHPLPDSSVRAQIGRAYDEQLRRLRQTEGPITAALQDRELASTKGLPSLAEILRLYRASLTRTGSGGEMREDLARRLHTLLVAPVEQAVAEASGLIVVPTGALGYLPFETLRDSAGTYLVEHAHVRYAQSLTVLRQLQRRDYESEGPRRKPLLALGGAAYEANRQMGGDALVAEGTDGLQSIATEERASSLLRSAEQRLEQNRSPRRAYVQLGYRQWTNLPDTKEEVGQLEDVTGPSTTAVTGASATEDTIRAMSERGALADYRYVHFATHGVAVPEAPALSALVLSQVGASDSLAAKDGYLNMREIADLEMQADVAVLSACQTGLGKVVAGEGVVSLSHAFLRAGANATLVSQWKVLDESTRQFMTAVYKRAKTEDTSFAEAVTEAKRAFITGEYGEKNTDPLRWAPFVYYGRE